MVRPAMLGQFKINNIMNKHIIQHLYSHCESLLPFGTVRIVAFLSLLRLAIHGYLDIRTGTKPVLFVFLQLG